MKRLVLLLPLILANTAFAQERNWGEVFYSENCASCHGDLGMGDGELAGILTVEVPNLTKLSAQNDGTFPMLYVIQVVDGRSGLRAHGNPMPPYGAMFREELQPPSARAGAVEPLIRGRILMIAEYIQSIQQ
ncbi:c-type cytochrome [Roseovarius sp.]|uniref:c-type cytochrome n=1 Tax=Roseovarius sp. TaxID=1486281 RepID=UPI003A976A18